MARIKPTDTVTEYIKRFPPKTQTVLRQLRKVIKYEVPMAEELISYGIAAYKQHGMLIYFAGYANHISIYPAPRTAPAFKKELQAYKGGKGTVQFPLTEPLPIDLVKRIVRYRLVQDEEKSIKHKPLKIIGKDKK